MSEYSHDCNWARVFVLHILPVTQARPIAALSHNVRMNEDRDSDLLAKNYTCASVIKKQELKKIVGGFVVLM